VTEHEFWVLMEGAREESGGVLKRQTQLLRDHLLAGSVEGLLEFRDRWDEVESRLFTWPIWDASCVLSFHPAHYPATDRRVTVPISRTGKPFVPVSPGWLRLLG
jgi:hypothetical protein